MSDAQQAVYTHEQGRAENPGTSGARMFATCSCSSQPNVSESGCGANWDTSSAAHTPASGQSHADRIDGCSDRDKTEATWLKTLVKVLLAIAFYTGISRRKLSHTAHVCSTLLLWLLQQRS